MSQSATSNNSRAEVYMLLALKCLQNVVVMSLLLFLPMLWLQKVKLCSLCQ